MDRLHHFSPQDVGIRKADAQDHDPILAITENEDLWDGMDYLPNMLNHWLEVGLEQSLHIV